MVGLERSAVAQATGMLALAARVSAFHPDASHFHGGGFGQRGPGQRGPGHSGGELDSIPIYYVLPFVALIIATISLMIYFIITDEKKEAKQRALDKRASSLKFGRADPRYYE
ncbi:hypothetical protein T492DRAFT_844373 [Pavlovales sp. CCMP2436]|nr:hypothetical protein T492DRAFT_844373 [Pavlovales sp. CCMP2436]|mmetsp:Transcript_22155/g.56137  ORF Transcript_22155/g.56137 Transcript_22155/m.56137 type:complete len:112 (+) Transcript_22155:106-441(+)